MAALALDVTIVPVEPLMGVISLGTAFCSAAKKRVPLLPELIKPATCLTVATFSGLFLCAACVPIKFTTSPGATGKIVDASTHTPINGAEVLVSRSTYPPPSADAAFTNSRPPVVMSGENGQFSVPSQRRVDLYFLPVDIFPRFGLLVVKHQGYETTCVPFWSKSVAELGEVGLKEARLGNKKEVVPSSSAATPESVPGR